MKTVTIYKQDGTKVVADKAPARESYDGLMSKPFHERVLNAYYTLECEGKPLGIKSKTKVAEIHKAALAEGF